MRFNVNEATTPNNTQIEETELDKLIPEYGMTKASADDFKKAAEAQNKKIKELMGAQDLTSYTAGEYTVTLSAYEKSNFNSVKLLSVIKTNPEVAKAVVKTQEYVDIDALEDILYKGNVAKEFLLEIDKCKESTTITTLRVTKKVKK